MALSGCASVSGSIDLKSAIARLPTLQYLVVGGDEFRDKHITQLSRLKTLNWLFLDYTRVSDTALSDLNYQLPHLWIWVNDRMQFRVGYLAGSIPMFLHGWRSNRRVGSKY